MPTLVIMLPPAETPETEPTAYALVDDDGTVRAEGAHALLDPPPVFDLQPARAVAVLPAEEVFVRRVEVPGRSDREARQAAPFLVEEDLAAPIEETDIIVGAKLDDGTRWLIAAAAAARAGWRKRAASFGVKPVHAASAAMLLRGHGGDLTVMQLGGVMLFQTAAADLAAQAEAETPAAPGDGPLCGGFPADLAAHVLPALGAAVAPKRLLISEDIDPDPLAPANEPIALKRVPVQDLRLNAAAAPDTAFAGLPAFFGDAFLSALDWGELIRPWRRAAVLAVAGVLGAAALIGGEAAYLDARADVYREASERSFREAFPEARRVVNPQAQLRQRMIALGAAEAEGGFLPLASALAGIAAETDSVRVDGLRYDAARGALIVSAVYSDFADFEALRAAAEARGVEIEDSGARQSAEGIAGDFILRFP